MSKKTRSEKVEIQRGPIDMNDQYTYRFKREPENTLQDIKHNIDRRSGQTLTLHEPKK
jgi:hypothetical protein